MLRRLIFTMLATVAALAAVNPGVSAKGWSGPRYYLAGDTWHRRTEVRFRSLDELLVAMRTPYFVYMIEATEAPVEPEDLRLGRVLLKRHPHDELSVVAEARFEIPDVQMGRYVVTFCTLNCKSALGRLAPVLRVLVVRSEAQRALFDWLDDWLQIQRGLEFLDDELDQIDWVANSARTTNGLQDWRLKSLDRRVDDLDSREGQGWPAGAVLASGLLGGALGCAGATLVASGGSRRGRKIVRPGLAGPGRGRAD
jgi:hypothetical protein